MSGEHLRAWGEPDGEHAMMIRLTHHVDCGGGAVMSIPNPVSPDETGIVWHLRHGNAEGVRMSAATLVESYDYLLSGEITAAEAIRRLRLLRRERYQLTADIGELDPA